MGKTHRLYDLVSGKTFDLEPGEYYTIGRGNDDEVNIKTDARRSDVSKRQAKLILLPGLNLRIISLSDRVETFIGPDRNNLYQVQVFPGAGTEDVYDNWYITFRLPKDEFPDEKYLGYVIHHRKVDVDAERSRRMDDTGVDFDWNLLTTPYDRKILLPE